MQNKQQKITTWRMHVTKKRGVLPTHSAIEPPYAQPRLDLPQCIQTSQLLNTRSIYSFPYLHTTSHKHTTHNDRTNLSGLHLLPSFTHTHRYQPKAFILYCRLFTLRKHKLSFQTSSQNSRPSSHRPISLSLSPNFYSNDLTRTTRRSGKSQAFGQDRPATDLSPSLSPSKFYLFILYRSIDLLQTIFLISF